MALQRPRRDESSYSARRWAMIAAVAFCASAGALPAHAQDAAPAEPAPAEPAPQQPAAVGAPQATPEDEGEPAVEPAPKTAPVAPVAGAGPRAQPVPRWRYDAGNDKRAGAGDDGSAHPAFAIAGGISLGFAAAFAVGGVVVMAANDNQPYDANEMQSLINGQVAQLALDGVVAERGDVFLPATEQPQTAISLIGLAAGSATLGVPLLLLGSAAKNPSDASAVYAGTALATAGVAVAGIGGAIATAQVSRVSPARVSGEAGSLAVSYDDDDGSIAIPLTLGIAGAAAAVVGVVVWAGGAGSASDADDSAEEARGAGGINARLHISPTGVNLRGTF